MFGLRSDQRPQVDTRLHTHLRVFGPMVNPNWESRNVREFVGKYWKRRRVDYVSSDPYRKTRSVRRKPGEDIQTMVWSVTEVLGETGSGPQYKSGPSWRSSTSIKNQLVSPRPGGHEIPVGLKDHQQLCFLRCGPNWRDSVTTSLGNWVGPGPEPSLKRLESTYIPTQTCRWMTRPRKHNRTGTWPSTGSLNEYCMTGSLPNAYFKIELSDQGPSQLFINTWVTHLLTHLLTWSDDSSHSCLIHTTRLCTTGIVGNSWMVYRVKTVTNTKKKKKQKLCPRVR